MYFVFSKAYPLKDIERDEKLIIDLTMSIKSSISSFRYSILLQISKCTQLGYNLILLEERIELSRHVISTLIKSKCLDTFTQLVFRFRLKFNEFVQGIKLPMHQVNISKPGVIICECDEILIPFPCMDIKGSHTSVHINSKHSLALYHLVLKDFLVILPSIQDSQTRRSLGIKNDKILDLISLWICLD